MLWDVLHLENCIEHRGISRLAQQGHQGGGQELPVEASHPQNKDQHWNSRHIFDRLKFSMEKMCINQDQAKERERARRWKKQGKFELPMVLPGKCSRSKLFIIFTLSLIFQACLLKLARFGKTELETLSSNSTICADEILILDISSLSYASLIRTFFQPI